MTLPRTFTRHVMRIVGTRSSVLDVARGRMVLVGAVFALLYIFVGARVVDLSLIQGAVHDADIALLEEDARVAAVSQEVPRGDIVDRNGVLLATSLETASLYADPALIADPQAVASDIVSVLPQLSYGDILQRLQRRGRFVWLMRNLTPSEQYDVLNLGHPGLGFKEEYQRIYPQENLLSHIVGYTDIDGTGLAGIERSFDALLKAGKERLRLTLDMRVQHILHREVSEALTAHKAKAAAGVVLDIASGDVLAMVSLPDFDPHHPHKNGLDPLFNRVTHGVYELGSTFKIFSTAALFEVTDASLGTVFDARKPLERGRYTIRDFHAQDRLLTVPEVFMHSSNIGSALMGEMIGTKALKDFYSDLGLLSPLELEIGEIGRPLVPQPWREINTLTASYGHGIAVSPMQMISAAASIAGGGTLIQPHLVLENNMAAMTKKSEKDRAVRIVSPQTAHRMRQLMRLVVTDGTGSHARVPGYNVGGKSGTAEKPGVGGYDHRRLVSSFIAFFPMNAPRYAVLVMLDEPRGNKQTFGYATGGWVAAPAAGDVIAALAPLMGVPPVTTPEERDFAATLKQYVYEASAEE